MTQPLLDLYTDYLISSFSFTTATGLSSALDGAVSHDKITRFLSGENFDSKTLWKRVKPLVRTVASGKDGVVIFDDTIEEKPYTDESELITWHFDHTKGRSVKGINVLSCLYHAQKMNIPLAIEPVKKPTIIVDPKTGKERRKATKTKNTLMREMLDVVVNYNQVPFAYVLMDVWFAAAETLMYIKQTLHKEFVCPIKTNRFVKCEKGSTYQSVDKISLEADIPRRVFIKDIPFEVSLMKHVFKNEDGSEGILYLVCSDLTIDAEKILTVYQTRWHIEEYHKSLKSLIGLEKSPTKTIRTQTNHLFSCVFAYVKLEKLKSGMHLNHFALKAKLYLSALKMSMKQLSTLQSAYAFA